MPEDVEDIQDAKFTGGVRSEVHLELLREGLLDGHAHKEIKRLAEENKALREALIDTNVIIAELVETSKRKVGDAEPADVIVWNEAIVYFAAKTIRELHARSALKEVGNG